MRLDARCGGRMHAHHSYLSLPSVAPTACVDSVSLVWPKRKPPPHEDLPNFHTIYIYLIFLHFQYIYDYFLDIFKEIFFKKEKTKLPYSIYILYKNFYKYRTTLLYFCISYLRVGRPYFLESSSFYRHHNRWGQSLVRDC